MRALTFGLLTFILMCAAGRAAEPPPPNDYTAPSSWLCRPGAADACAVDLSATTIAADGVTRQTLQPDPAAPIDCFYVYPTVSHQPSLNSDMVGETEERTAAKEQFVRFGSKCRLFAPLYRQVTIMGLFGGGDTELAYHDVLAAWNAYLAHDNGGRGVVLIGHSQGAAILTRLIAEQIDGKPLQAQLVGAILLGTELDVPIGKDAGGTFAHVPLCRAHGQAGCAIAYSSYLASDPPGDDAHFGMSDQTGMMDACVDPAALDGVAALDANLPALGANARFGTTYVRLPNVLTGRCTRSGTHSYLAIAAAADDPRADRINSLLTRTDTLLPGWGLHLLDVNLSLGNLVDVVGTQAQSWRRQHPR